jgi:hypothetical protein
MPGCSDHGAWRAVTGVPFPVAPAAVHAARHERGTNF